VWVTATSVDTPRRFLNAADRAAWIAKSGAQDFRQCKWTFVKLESEEGLFRYLLKRPDKGYAAVLGEVRYTIDGRATILNTLPRILD
jgi:hypothetical protein